MQSTTVHPCDEILPAGKLVTLGLQHVLVMYAGAVAVPLIIGSALKLPKDQIAFLISADLFACGIATLIQTLGVWIFGIRLPVIMGCTFASVGPLIAIGTNPSLGLLDVFGSTIAAGVIGIVIAPVIGKLLRFFPPVVVGTVIAVIGLSLMGVGINWAAGGVGNPEYGNPVFLGLSLLVLVLILMINKFGRGFFANIAVLLGIVAGFVIALSLGRVDLDGVAAAPWGRLRDALPLRHAAFRRAVDRHHGDRDVRHLHRVDRHVPRRGRHGRPAGRPAGPGARPARGRAGHADRRHLQLVPAYLVLAERRAGGRDWREEPLRVCVTGGVILVLLGLFPKMAQIVASVPAFVLGGAGIVMFGMVAANGVKTLSRVDFVSNHNNLFIVAVSIGLGLVPVVSPHFFSKLPGALAPILHSGILLASVSAVLLNLIFNGVKSEKQAECEIRRAGHDLDPRTADLH